MCMCQSEIEYLTLIYRRVNPVRFSYFFAILSIEFVSLGLHFICLYLFMFARKIAIDKRIYYPLGKLALLTSLQSIALQPYFESKISKNGRIACNQE